MCTEKTGKWWMLWAESDLSLLLTFGWRNQDWKRRWDMFWVTYITDDTIKAHAHITADMVSVSWTTRCPGNQDWVSTHASSTFPFIHPPNHPSAIYHPPTYSSTHYLSIYPFIYLFTHLSTSYPSIHTCVHSFMNASIHSSTTDPPTHPFIIYPSICTSIHPPLMDLPLNSYMRTPTHTHPLIWISTDSSTKGIST